MPKQAQLNQSHWKALKGGASCGYSVPVISRRLILATLVAIILCVTPHGSWINVEASSGKSSDFSFSGGPDSEQVISGTYTIRLTSVENLDYINIELIDVNTQTTPIANVTSAPWLSGWDTSSHSDGDYTLRARGTLDNGSDTGWITSPTFTLDNTAPSSLSLSVSNSIIGDGSSTINRAWFTSPESGTLDFSWSASDEHLSYATLTNIPGSGTPPTDGPGTITGSWSWSPGDLSEGTWTPLLTVFDEAGNSAQTSIHLGIDRTGPTVGQPSLSVTPNVWNDATTLIFSDLSSSASDSGGSGIDSYQVRDSENTWSDISSAGFGTMPLDEGNRTIQFRAVDRVGNVGTPHNVTMLIDRTAPTAGGWLLPDLTDSLFGQVSISVDATDANSGIDVSECRLEYGFDANGAGSIPDISSDWLSVGSGTSNSLTSAIDWSTTAGQYLSLRATLVDEAGNSVTIPAQHFLILPGLDFSVTDASLDRLIVRAGSQDPVLLQATINSNEIYDGSVVIGIQSAPASRDSTTEWTTLDSIVISNGNLIDQSEEISLNISLLTAGEFDLRIIVDPDNSISERDEGNNEAFLLIGAADPDVVGSVSGFVPSAILILLAGFIVTHLINRRQSAS